MTTNQVFTKYGNRSNTHYVTHDENGKTLIVFGNKVARETPEGRIQLDWRFWDYSSTTHYYRGQFLGENTAATRKRLESGEYELTHL